MKSILSKMTWLSLRATAKSPLHFAPTAQSSGSPSKSQHTSSTSEAVPPPTLSQNQSFSLPPGQAVCCFMDGGVGLYDMGAKKWDFLRDLVLNTPPVQPVCHHRQGKLTEKKQGPAHLWFATVVFSRATSRQSLTASLSLMIQTCWPRLVLTEPSRSGTQTRWRQSTRRLAMRAWSTPCPGLPVLHVCMHVHGRWCATHWQIITSVQSEKVTISNCYCRTSYRRAYFSTA